VASLIVAVSERNVDYFADGGVRLLRPCLCSALSDTDMWGRICNMGGAGRWRHE
jgi:hypothetical protein